MKVMVIPVADRELRMAPKILEKGLGDQEIGERIETIQATTQFGSARILERVLKI